MTIITESPGWFIVLCLIAGLVYAGALYFKDRFNRNYGSGLATLLGALRFVTVAVLAFFILKPIIKSLNRTVEKPILIFCQDNSQSIAVNKDSTYYKTKYLEELTQLQQSFGEQYEIKSYRFGSLTLSGIDSVAYNEKLTDFSGLYNELSNRYSGRNIGAIIIASDGLYNKGSNPVNSFKRFNVPVYTIALGDTTVYKDLLISDIATNRLAYLGNKFPVSITAEAQLAAGEQVQLSVSKKGQILFQENFQVAGNRFFKTFNLSLDATEIGLQRYTVNLSRVSNELTYLNNTKDIFIDVLDSRERVLVLAHAPHPDLNAIKEAITGNENYSVEVKLAKDFSGDLKEYSMVVFHQLPAIGGEGLNTVKNALDTDVPSLFVWGGATDFNAFNSLGLGYTLIGSRNNNTDAGGYVSEGFSLFSIDDDMKNMIKRMPPLSVPFGDLSVSPGVNDFIKQQVGQIQTKRSLISFNEFNDKKIGVICGEGLWRWRLSSFQQFETHDRFNSFVTKVIQFLSAKDDKSLFRVSGNNSFNENEVVLFNAELYNKSYEPLLNKEISMRVLNDSGEEFSFVFSPSESNYRLQIGQLPVGAYSYEAKVQADGQVLLEKGEFVVRALQYETTRVVADHNLMYQLAQENGGRMLYPSAMSEIASDINARKDIVSVSYESKKLDDLINYKWILFLLIFLLGTEWLLRKRAGTY